MTVIQTSFAFWALRIRFTRRSLRNLQKDVSRPIGCGSFFHNSLALGVALWPMV
jgi:hypothetical protein